MSANGWIQELAELAERYGQCLPNDLADMPTSELWGLYLFLSRKAQGEKQ